jgi:hypothetical protein
MHTHRSSNMIQKKISEENIRLLISLAVPPLPMSAGAAERQHG